MRKTYSIEELHELIDYDDKFQSEVTIPNYLFDELKLLVNKGKLKKQHIGFAYSYIYIITYMSRYAKYDKVILSTKEIKEILGYTSTNKTLDYIIKRNGLLDECNITLTSNDFPIIAIFEDDGGIEKEFKITFASELWDDMREFKKERKANLNTLCKLPMFGFYQNPKDWGTVEPYDGTFFYSYDDSGIDFTLLDFKVFAFCMSYSEELGCNAFYLYSFLKYQNYKFSDGYNATRKTISNETLIAERTLQNCMNNMRAHKMITTIHNMEYFSLGWKEEERKASSHKINEYNKFTYIKTEYDKLEVVKQYNHFKNLKGKHEQENSNKVDIGLDELPF